MKNKFTLVTPTECENPCTFKAEVSGDVARVEYFADDWSLGNSANGDNNYAIEYDFFGLGNQKMEAVSYDSDELSLQRTVNGWRFMARARCPMSPITISFPMATIQVEAAKTHPLRCSSPTMGTPSFQTPSASHGAHHMPKAHQAWPPSSIITPMEGIPQRLTPVTNGTLGGLKAELDEGRPVIIHGYFTSYGHIMVVLGYDEGGYWVNDPAGEWAQYFGGYPYGWAPNVGKDIYYSKDAFEAAVATSDGYNYLPLWYHLVR